MSVELTALLRRYADRGNGPSGLMREAAAEIEGLALEVVRLAARVEVLHIYANMTLECERLTRELEGARAELQRHRDDIAAASGELLVPLPEPGTDMARLMIANRLMRRELEEARERGALPRTADGVPIVPGMVLWRDYFGARWEARVVAVASTRIDVHHTDEPRDRIMPTRIRNVDPGKWYALASPQESPQ